MATYNLGRIIPVFRGTWNLTTEYMLMDVVYYNGSSYISKLESNTAKPPTANPQYWQIVALKGELSPTLTPEQEQYIIEQVIEGGGFVSDADYTHTDNNFTNAYKTQLDGLEVNDTTITIKANNATAGTFTTNQEEESTINLTIPTLTTDLTDSADIYRRNILEILADPNIQIGILKPRNFYVTETGVKLKSLDIQAFIDAIPDIYVQEQTFLKFTPDDGFTFSYPTDTQFIGGAEPDFQPHHPYLMTFMGNICRTEQL